MQKKSDQTTFHKKIHLKWIKDLNIGPETITLQKKTQAIHLLTQVLAILFLTMSPKAREPNAKMNKWDYTKLEIFCTLNKKLKKKKRERERKYCPLNWIRLFQKIPGRSGRGFLYIFNKELI